jgi:hypothetical protein
MNTIKNLFLELVKAFGLRAAVVAILLLAPLLPAFGQGGFLDFFAAPKTLVLTPATVLYQSGTTTLNTTNIANISRFEGICALDISSCSNGVWGTANNLAAGYATTNSITLYWSITGTNNWTIITNAFLATSTTLIVSNYWGTTNSAVLYTTNTYEVPGTLTYPSVANGWSGQYVQPPSATNSLSNMNNLVGNTNWLAGFTPDGTSQTTVSSGGLGQFIAIVYTTSGSNAVYSVSATLRGRTMQGIY